MNWRKCFLVLIYQIILLKILQCTHIYAGPDVFFTYLCRMGGQRGIFFPPDPTTETHTCSTGVSHTNVIRYAIALTQGSKTNPDFLQFTSTVSPKANQADYTITLTLYHPVLSDTRVSFFLVLIKSQTTEKYIDFIDFAWAPGSLFDNNNNNVRTQTISQSITTQTIFTTVPAGLVSVPFATHFKIWPSVFFGIPDVNDVLKYSVTSSVSSPNLLITMTVQPQGRLRIFQGFSILINPTAITTAQTNGLFMDYLVSNYAVGSPYSFTTVFSQYGPSFNSKCIFGFYQLRMSGNDNFDFFFQDNTVNYTSFRQNTGSTAAIKGNSLCFGNDTICIGTTLYKDYMNYLCYTPSTCPLPVFTDWTIANTCPPCIQLVCLKCLATDRSSCSKCATGSTLSGTTCACSTNYVDVYTNISTSSLGLWAGTTQSLSSCRLNCTLVIPHCLNFDCTNQTYCLICQIGYYLNLINSTDQNCPICSSSAPLTSNCLTCDNSTFCTSCQTNYYLKSILTGSTVTSITCQICNMPLVGCLICTDNLTCTNCSAGYLLNSTTCYCNINYASISQCLECGPPNECVNCAVGYYVNSTTKLCSLCQIHPNCTQCSDQITCTKCMDSSYWLDSVIQPGTVNCSYCPDLISGCNPYNCISLTFCNQCVLGYYLNSINSTNRNCLLCNASMSYCTSCNVNNVCLACQPKYKLNTSNLCDCDPVASNLNHCLICTSPTVCTSCASGSSLNTVTNLCQTCDVIHPNCTTCSDLNTCTVCHSTYVLDTLTTSGMIKCILCSTVIPNCTILGCTSQTRCTSCDTGYYLLYVDSTHQTCDICSNPLALCQACLNNTHCTQCPVGYYVNTILSSSIPIKQQCDVCSNPIPQCIICSNNNTCFNCTVGYKVNLSNKCECDVTTYNLTFCINCTIPTQCLTCQAGYYLNSTSKRCQHCSKIHVNCTLCSDQNTCTACHTTYIPDPGAVPNKTVCTLCELLINNCTQCDTTTTCTNCHPYYGVTNNVRDCEFCDTLVMEGCDLCQNSSFCVLCDNQTLQINGSCYYCERQRYKCVHCIVTTALQLACIECQLGYILHYSSFFGYNVCQSCRNVVNFCFTCNTTGCLSCVLPYLIGPTRLCDQCVAGYQFIAGYCIKYPGCINSITLADGSDVCLACITQLHFVYVPALFRCVCDLGYENYYPPGLLMQCTPVCGDGIALPLDEQCDDGNAIDKDGCSPECKINPNFLCSGSPSHCVLQFNFNVITFNYAMRVIGQNKAKISYTITPPHEGLQNMNWRRLLKLNFTSTSINTDSLSFNYLSITGQLQIQVIYTQKLQDTYLQLNVTFDPDLIISHPSTLILTNKLNGINMPLILDPNSLLMNKKIISTLSTVMIGCLIGQFYLGSYFHKMIGLQTLTVIQIIYFVRMIGPQSSSSILSSFNTIQYAATGYQNSQLLFQDSKQQDTLSLKTIPKQFSAINLKKYFLMNVNFFLFPPFISLIVYGCYLFKKYRLRTEYLQTLQQQKKDIYTKYCRECLKFYNYFLFPYTIMFTPIMFFNSVLYLNSTQSNIGIDVNSSIETQSFYLHLTLLFITTSIYCSQIFSSIQEFKKFGMTIQQRNKIPKSTIQKLQHDENNPDRPNYHPFYVFVFLFCSFFLWILMILPLFVTDFKYFLEVIAGFSVAYFLLITIWKPYHELINAHNHFLKLNHGTVVLFIGICVMFDNVTIQSQTAYIAIMYVIMSLISIIMIGGYIRILFQKKFKKKMESNTYDLFINTEGLNDKTDDKYKQQEPQLTKMQKMVLDNKFAFQNQLKQMSYKFRNNTKKLTKSDKITQILSAQVEQVLINKIRQQYHEQARKNSILQDFMQKQDPHHSQQKLYNIDKNDYTKIPAQNNSPLLNKLEQKQQLKSRKTVQEKEKHDLLNQLKSRMRKQWRLLQQKK